MEISSLKTKLKGYAEQVRQSEAADRVRTKVERGREAFDRFMSIDHVDHGLVPKSIGTTPYGLVRRPVFIGVTSIVGFLGVFLLWAALAPLTSAAIASGQVTVDSNRKAVQHLEGGIVKDILVSEGARVEQGDVLVRLDDTNTSASVDLLLAQYRTSMAREAALIAEQDGLEAPVYPKELLLHAQSPEVREVIETQDRLFMSRKRALQGQVDVLDQQVNQFEQEIAGLKAQMKSEQEQLKLIEEEVESVTELFNKGLERKPRLLALRRTQTEIGGRIGQFQADIARARQRILQNDLSIKDIINRFLAQSAEQLKETQTQLADLQERLKATQNQQMRTAIVAPRSGIVVNMKTHTIGGIVQPGETVMEIVPIGDSLIVSARVNPRDIDVVYRGQEARVVLSAYNARNTPNLDAVVRQVSADILRDEVTGDNYYSARVEVDLAKLDAFKEVQLYPGMPVEVMMVTGKRTALQYLTAPFRSTFRRGGREA